MKIQLFCTLFVLSAGATAFADCPAGSFTKLEDCRNCVRDTARAQQVTPEPTVSAIDSQCRQLISVNVLSSENFCIEQATLNYRAQHVVVDVPTADRDLFVQRCQQPQIAGGAGGTVQGAPNLGSSELQRIRDAAAEEERRRQQQPTQTGTGSSSNSGSRGGSGGGLGSIGDALGGVADGIGNWFQNGSPRENNGLTALPPVPGTSGTDNSSSPGISGGLARGVAGALGQNSPVLTPTQLADARQDVVAGGDSLVRTGTADATGAARDLHHDGTGLGTSADQAQRQGSEAESAPTPRTGISGDSDIVRQRLEEQVQSRITSLKAGLNTATDPYKLTNSVGTLEEAERKMSEYFVEREKCVKGAERAQFLCAEGSSPGAQASRAMINLSGPVLAGITSMQRTCNSTANVAKFVSGLMTAAKGVCIGAKVACDMSCNAVLRTHLRNLDTLITTTLSASAESDGARLRPLCTEAAIAADATGIAAAQCPTATTNVTFVKDYAQQFDASLAVEEGLHPGTVAGLKKHCDDKIIDIAMMGANIASLAAAKNSAQRCAEQTAGQTASGDSTVAAGMYCDQASNQQTQFCVCQRNPMETTCPEYLASQQSRIDQLNAESDARAQGLNLRPGSGVSAFAGGSPGATPGSSSGLAGGLDLSGGSSGSSAGIEATSNSPSAESGAPVVGGGASAGGGFGSSARGSSDAVAKPGTVAEKAPSALKSLASSIGGLFGGKGESSDNGSISARAPSAETVQQRRASERLAAEISPANGKSNWQKVREQYLSSEPSFIFGQ